MNLNSIRKSPKKFVLIIAIVSLILTGFSLKTISANASTVNVVVGKNYYVTYDFERSTRHPNYHPSYQYYNWHWGDLHVDGQIVYCLDPETKIPNPNGYTSSNWNDYTKAQQDRMILIANYGAGYDGNNSAKMRFATQVMIWDVAGWNVKNIRVFGSQSSFDISNEIALINSRIANHTKRPAFHNTTQSVKVGETFTLTDSTLSSFDVNSLPNGLKLVNKSGNSLTLEVTSNAIDNGSLSLIKKAANKEGSSIVYKKPGNQTFAMFKNDDPVYATLHFELTFGNIEISKKDTNGNIISNAVFELSNDKSNIIGTYTTASNGKATINDLIEGTYYIREKSVPSPLIVDTSWKEIKVTAGQTVTLTATNSIAVGKIEVTKKSIHGDLIPGTSFEIRDKNSKLVDELITDSNGYAQSKDLILGSYSVTEVSVPEPLVLDTTPINVTIRYKDQITPIVVEGVEKVNDYQRSDLTLNKVENDWDTLQPEYNGLNLSGATLELYAKEDIREGSKLIYRSGELIGKEVTNTVGQVKFHNLPLGEYFAKETVAPEGYILSDNIWNISLKYDNGKVTTEVISNESTLTNQIVYGKSKIHKTSNGGKEFLEGAIFGLFTDSGESLGEFTTDSKGELVSPNLRYGTYYWQELKAPTGYYLDNTKHFFEISLENHQDIVHLPITNEYIEMKLQIIKTDAETSIPLQGAVFEIYDENDELVTFSFLDENYETQVQNQFITNVNGVAFTRGNLKYGNYTLVEVEAPKGYIRQEPVEFSIDEKTTSIELPVIGRTKVQEVSNQPTTTEIVKLSENSGEPLEGAHLQLIHKETNEILLDWVSDGESVVFKGLHIGEPYVLKEVKAPKGYFVADPIEFVVKETTEAQTIIMLDELIPEIKTQAFYENGDKVNLGNHDMTVIDTVSYKNLVVGKEYTLRGKLLTIDTQGSIAESEITFTAEKPNGTIDLTFKFDGSLLLGKTLVVFEDLYRDERLVATHSDLTDKDQTIYIPNIKTSASASEYTSNSKGFVTINDIIRYEGLEPNREYQAIGWLMINMENELLNSDGERYEASIVFTPTSTNGTVEVSFNIPIKLLTKGNLVIFEELYIDDKLIAEHKDINDKDQTVSFIKIVIQKIDVDTHLPLEGVEFTLYDVNGNPLETLKTDEHGLACFLVPKGNYYAKETKALEGYISSNETYDFRILGNEENHEVVLKIENKKIPELPKTGTGITKNEIIAIVLLSTGIFLIFLHLKKKESKNEENKD